MSESLEDERDDECFNQVYGKEYTGPPTLNTEKSLENSKLNKRSRSSGNAGESNVEQQEHDPNSMPTNFTIIESKVWEANSKEIERNWKQKKAEFNYKIYGEFGHFTQVHIFSLWFFISVKHYFLIAFKLLAYLL